MEPSPLPPAPLVTLLALITVLRPMRARPEAALAGAAHCTTVAGAAVGAHRTQAETLAALPGAGSAAASAAPEAETLAPALKRSAPCALPKASVTKSTPPPPALVATARPPSDSAALQLKAKAVSAGPALTAARGAQPAPEGAARSRGPAQQPLAPPPSE